MRSLIAGVLFFVGQVAFASNGLVIHAAEIGLGKFHRKDNSVHAYAKDNVWAHVILPDGADPTKPLTRKNSDGSFTVFFQTLEGMVAEVARVARTENKLARVVDAIRERPAVGVDADRLQAAVFLDVAHVQLEFRAHPVAE